MFKLLHSFNAHAAQSLLLVIDIQDKLQPAMQRYEQVKQITLQLAKVADLLAVPTLITQQYKQGLGETDLQLQQQFNQASYFDKTHFSACKEPGFLQQVARFERRQIIVVGMEAHVCVLQTCLDLLANDYQVFLIADGVSSRNDLHRDLAIAQLRQAGAVISCAESVIFQWAEVANTSLFKKVLELVK
ncbi:isochorismatase family protein [Pseudoalteromonas prydzensis]|uniref:isochorismatase family protein n=1 Tax=Pseudoalteromonas prydzensis TaxID=182141 RepID=UPI0024BC930D|nr:isochorismatase family protein [Pseudoalteromonas prydzensis]